MPLFTTRPALESLAIAIASSSKSYAITLSTRPKISSQASVISLFTFTTSGLGVVWTRSWDKTTVTLESVGVAGLITA